jgi:hypothetical protein
MNYLYKLLFGGESSDPYELYNSIPWGKINSLSMEDAELLDIYKKLYILHNKYKLSLKSNELSLLLLYFKKLSNKLPKDVIDKIQTEVAQEAKPEVASPAKAAVSTPTKAEVSTPTKAEVAIVPELKSIQPVMSDICNKDTQCKTEFNKIDWKLITTLKKEDPKTKETLDQLEHLKKNFISSFDSNTQQLIKLYIKILRKKLDLTTETKPEIIQTLLSGNINKYCKPFYLDGNSYSCIGTSILSDNDTEKCVYNPNKIVKRNINIIDLDPNCENNIQYKSPFPQAKI